jgi:ATP-dependent RNA helicase DDX35
MASEFWRPGTFGPGSSLDRASEAEGNIVPSAPSYGHLSIQAQRERLPIFKHREKLLYCVETFGFTIVHGQTGCGKTTRESPLRRSFCGLMTLRLLPAELPQYLFEAGWAKDGNVIACTQPRRVAVTSVATRVAAEVGTLLGDEVRLDILSHS